MNNIEPTGILGRVFFHHEKGGRMDVLSQHLQLRELGVTPETYDDSVILKVGTNLELHGTRYQILAVSIEVLPYLNSASIPAINPETYFTDTSDPLPNNLFIHVTLRPL